MSWTLDLGNLLVHLRANDEITKTVEKTLGATAKKLDTFGRNAMKRVSLPLMAVGLAGVKAFSDFDDAMTKSLAIMNGITPQLRSQMEGVALGISKSGTRSATDLAKSYFFLASAGYDAAQSMKALPVVAQFAAAGQFDLSVATTLASDSMSALGLKSANAQTNMENLLRVTDVLVAANTLANANTEQFAAALTHEAGAAMKNWAIKLEEGVAVLAAYADQGLKAEAAGTMFGRMLRMLMSGFSQNRADWSQFGIDIYDTAGELKPLAAIIEDLTRVLKPLSAETKVATLEMLGFEARSQQAILPLIGTAEQIRKYTQNLEVMTGFSKAVAEKNAASFAAQMKIIWNNVIAASIAIGERLAPGLEKLGNALRTTTEYWSQMHDPAKDLVVQISVLAALMGPTAIGLSYTIKGLILLKTAMLSSVTAATLLQSALAGVFVGLASYKLGSYLYEEFDSVAIVTHKVIGSVSEAWESVKHASDLGILYLRSGWNKFKVWWTELAADVALDASEVLQHMETVASDIAGSYVSLGSQQAHALSLSMRRSAKDAAQSFDKEFAESTKTYQQRLEDIRKITDAAIVEVNERSVDRKSNAEKAQAAANAIQAQANALNKVAANLSSNIDLTNELNDATSLTTEQIEAYRSIMGELGKVTEAGYAAQLTHVTRIADGYKAIGIDIETVNRWLARQTTLLDIAAQKAGTLREQLAAAAAELKLEIEEAGGVYYQFAKEMPSMLENGLMNSLKAGRDWKDQMISFIQEVGWEFARTTAVRPLAQYLSTAIMSVGSSGGSRDSSNGWGGSYTPYVSTEPGVTTIPGLADGGVVSHPTLAALAEAGKPEAVVPLDRIPELSGGQEIKSILRELLRETRRKNVVNPVVIDRREDVATVTMLNQYRRK